MRDHRFHVLRHSWCEDIVEYARSLHSVRRFNPSLGMLGDGGIWARFSGIRAPQQLPSWLATLRSISRDSEGARGLCCTCSKPRRVDCGKFDPLAAPAAAKSFPKIVLRWVTASLGRPGKNQRKGHGILYGWRALLARLVWPARAVHTRCADARHARARCARCPTSRSCSSTT